MTNQSSRLNSEYVNTIPKNEEPNYPGDQEIEWRIRSIIRWNAMAMVVRANREHHGLGGHISTYASAATLYEVGFHHFFKGRDHPDGPDFIFFQGHASPGIYARSYLEGRLSADHLRNFRQEIKSDKGLSSYPHPWLMPHYWQFPTVSMGLGPLMAIYQARFIHYLEDRQLKPKNKSKVWAFLGDGETDEPESLGSLSLASREQLDNLIFVVNCNLQRLDGPVRGNGKIIQELESVFKGAGWNVIKVIWGRDWDELFKKDKNGILKKRLEEIVDGQYQKYTVEKGDYIREHFCHTEELKELFHDLSDESLEKLRRGGHDETKVYAAYDRATQSQGAPTVILAKTIKGYGLGEAGEGKNITHQQKQLNEEELRNFRARFGIPITDEELPLTPFFRPNLESQEIKYLLEKRKKLGGFLPERKVDYPKIELKSKKFWDEFFQGSGGREVSTTMAFVRILSKLLKDEDVGKYIVPIVPDEARTFGMETLFRQCGIYSHVGQKYEPVDRQSLMYYKESTDGQILEEGITEAGGMSSFIAAGTSYANHGIPMIPFFIYYSMFGFQRVGDLIWAGADMRTKGFLVGATAGRTTLMGEGLQHQDGQSHLLAHSVPNLHCYDLAFGHEIAVVIKNGLKKMYIQGEDIFYYLTVENENYEMPGYEVDEKLEDQIMKGMYLFQSSKTRFDKKLTLLASGPMVREAMKAAYTLEDKHQISVDIWSVTSWQQLYREASETQSIPYITEQLNDQGELFIAVSDYVKILPDSLAKYIPGKLISLGTDGFGRSDTRERLRDYFKVSSKYIISEALKNFDNI